jgi:uncharacterized protein (DUF2141 family)
MKTKLSALIAPALAVMITVAAPAVFVARADQPAAAAMAPAAAPATARARLTVNFAGITQASGFMMVGLYRADAWDGEAVRGARVPINASTATTVFEGLEPGEYGLKIFHDVDGNGDMNANLFGIPTEPFAFSNNAPARFGPAKIEDAKFTLTAAGATQAITIQ